MDSLRTASCGNVRGMKRMKRPDLNHCFVCGRDVRRIKERTQDGHQHATIKCWVDGCEASFTVCGSCGGIVRAQAMRSFHELTLHGHSSEALPDPNVSEIVRAIANTGAYDIADALACRFQTKICAVCGYPGDVVQTSFRDFNVHVCKACRSGMIENS